jgi:hypothetical protein
VEKEDEEAARRAFNRGIEVDDEMDSMREEPVVKGIESGGGGGRGKIDVEVKAKGVVVGDMPPPEFKRAVKKKKDFSAALGIKKKPSLV